MLPHQEHSVAEDCESTRLTDAETYQSTLGGGGGNRTPVHSILLQLLRIRKQVQTIKSEGLAL